MNSEQLQDALNLLDEDLIEETQRLRSGTSRRLWVRWMSLAACVCILAGTWAVMRWVLPSSTDKPLTDGESYWQTDSDNSDGSQDMQVPTDSPIGDVNKVPNGAPEQEPTEGLQDPAPMPEAPVPMAYVLVQIRQWDEGGFAGEVTGGAFPQGTRVQVNWDKPGTFPVGSTVRVTFTEYLREDGAVTLDARSVEKSE